VHKDLIAKGGIRKNIVGTIRPNNLLFKCPEVDQTEKERKIKLYGNNCGKKFGKINTQ
jgi:hypothetical protein